TLAPTTGVLTIQGNGATVDGNGHVIIDDASSALLTVDAIALKGGHNANGGAILEGAFPTPGSVVITNSTIINNTSDDLGGGIFVGGHGTLTVTNSTIANNTSGNAGGGMEADAGVTVTNSTISGNTAASWGGGIFSEATTVTNSTIANNTAGPLGGGGIYAEGTVTFVYATVAGNHAPASTGANVDGADETQLTSFGSVIASPQGGGANCAALTGTTSQGWNWDDDGTCGFGAGTGDHPNGGNPQLGALVDNGGPTQTMLPQATSLLIDAIPTASCGAGVGIHADQIGTSRPQGPGCDIGPA